MSKYENQVNEILTQNGLDFTIHKEPIMFSSGAESNMYGLINGKLNKHIHTVSDGYHVTQNADVVRMVLQGTEKFGSQLKVNKAGSMDEGRKIYLQLEIEGEGIVGGDVIKQYITVLDSNDGSTGLSVGIGDLTMSCQNQFFKFYRAANMRFRHSASAEEKIRALPRMIENALAATFKQIEVYRKFQQTEVTRELAHSMVEYLLGYDRMITSPEELAKVSTRSINKMDELYDSINSEMDEKGNNLWGLHSGVTHFTTHKNHSKRAMDVENGMMKNLMLNNSKMGSYRLSTASMDFCNEKAEILLG